MQQAPKEVQELFGKMFAELERDSMARERKAAEADPGKYRLSRVIPGPGGLNYHWTFGGTNRRHQRVMFCWAIHRNVAGYFLTWRQIRQKNGIIKRDDWAARKTKKGAMKIALRRAAAFNEKSQG